jgi:hypothetical protein
MDTTSTTCVVGDARRCHDESDEDARRDGCRRRCEQGSMFTLHPNVDKSFDDPTCYRYIVGSFIYLSVTSSDISYSVYIWRQFVSAPIQIHYSHILCIICYLRGTISHRLFFSHSSSLQLQTYCNTTWAGDPSDRHSLSIYCIFLDGSLIAWKTKK